MSAPLGKIRNRQIQYFGINDKNWLALLPDKNWLLFLIADDEQIPQFDDILKICLERNVLYVCSTGKAANKIEDIFDEEIGIKTINLRSDYEQPVTTSHKNFDEGFWFATNIAPIN